MILVSQNIGFSQDKLNMIFLCFCCLFFFVLFLFSLKPKIKVKEIELDKLNNKINVKISNVGYFTAFNIKVQICSINRQTGKIKYYKIDVNDFLILPAKKDNNRIYYSNSISDESWERIISNEEYVRVRVYASHSLSGFGKAIEKTSK